MKITKRSVGTTEDFMNAIRNRLSALDGAPVNSEVNVESAEDAPSTDSSYLDELISNVESQLQENGITPISTDYDDSNISIIVVNSMTEYSVPFDDLQFDYDAIDDDTRYIVDTIVESEDQTVESCESDLYDYDFEDEEF